MKRFLLGAYSVLLSGLVFNLGCGAEDDSEEDQSLCTPGDQRCDPSGETDGGIDSDIPNEPDFDEDGIPDEIEGTEDYDGDGQPNMEDLDSDGDEIPDFLEGTSDTDGDGQPNYLDEDSDGDGIRDRAEGSLDSDGDGVENYLDEDSDNDGIPDQYESLRDGDEDGLPSYLDDDSDGDGVLDTDEYGRTDGGPPIDLDNDGIYDFEDVDADGDGLADVLEMGCDLGSTESRNPDSDNDGYSDLVEVAFASDPCDAESDIRENVDFYFELPFNDPAQHDTLEFSTDVQQGDIVFNMDTTGSMDDELGELRSALSNQIVPSLAENLPDSAFGVTHFDDFPCGEYGNSGDQPFQLHQRVTNDIQQVQFVVNNLRIHSGDDFPESGIPSIYQIATGEGEDWCYDVPPFDPALNYIPDVAYGTIGGVGFREGSVPLVVHITDAPTHTGDESNYHAQTWEETFAATEEIGLKVIGVISDNNETAYEHLVKMATRTGAVVPTCAWDEARPANCNADQCCTAMNGAGRAPNDGECPLVFNVNSNGSGLGNSIVTGLAAAISFGDFDVTTRLRKDEAVFSSSGIDTTCFISAVRPLEFTSAGGACSSTPEIVDFDEDGELDGFTNVTPGTQLLFDIEAMNECVPATSVPQTFILYIDVMGDEVAILDTQIVTILVPPDPKLN